MGPLLPAAVAVDSPPLRSAPRPMAVSLGPLLTSAPASPLAMRVAGLAGESAGDLLGWFHAASTAGKQHTGRRGDGRLGGRRCC